MRSRNRDLAEAIGLLEMRDWLDRESLDYRETRGSSGDQLNVRQCPCCGNTSYKVYLNAETGLGNCFAGDCQTKFNKWSFIKAHLDHLSNREVVEHIMEVAKELGWRPPKRESLAVSLDSNELRLPESLEIPIAGKNLKYLENRGVSVEMARYFKLRYCHKGSFAYEHDGFKRRQRYDKRIIIPIFDLMGDLQSYQGRDITGEAEKKYLFPPGFASTGSLLYNGHNAWGAETVLVGEGVFDVIAAKIALDADPALRDVVPVGTFGKHLSNAENGQVDKFVQLKAKGLKHVVFMWDGERQAFEDAIDAALLLSGYGIKTSVATLPPGRDPNEVPGEVVREAFYKATPINTLSATRLKLSRLYC